jgi:hypothetical protein
MVTEINEARRHANLSSAIRLFVLDQALNHGKKTESQEITKCGGRASLPRIGSLTSSFVAGIINAVIGAVILSAVIGFTKKRTEAVSRRRHPRCARRTDYLHACGDVAIWLLSLHRSSFNLLNMR